MGSSAHEMGSTTRKNAAKRMVGKSTVQESFLRKPQMLRVPSPAMPVEVWTVADDAVVVHADPMSGGPVVEHTGLPPSTEIEIDGFGTVRTLDRPAGERLATFCTVNDVHFGEDRCGALDDSPKSGRS